MASNALYYHGKLTSQSSLDDLGHLGITINIAIGAGYVQQRQRTAYVSSAEKLVFSPTYPRLRDAQRALRFASMNA